MWSQLAHIIIQDTYNKLNFNRNHIIFLLLC